MSAICEEGSGATRPFISETASQYVTADRPETTAAFPASQESQGKQPKVYHQPEPSSPTSSH